MDKAYFNWSSGKDSSLALYYAMQSPIITVEALFSVIDSDGNLPMHNVGSHLLKKQADSIGLPLTIFSYCKKWTEKEYRIAMREYVEKFKEEIPRYMIKHQVRPGLTGWAQINGYRGDTSIRKRIEYDIYYIENWSMSFDFKIMFLTIFRGFINENAY